MKKQSCIYILASKKNGTLYIGVTSNLPQRICQHKQGQTGGFTKKYNIYLLVHCEIFDDMEYAIKREKQLKNWKRQWKIDLTEKNNPNWEDLSEKYILH